jgi:prepilin-type N-terminal cleavage/methylation domain-containing protein
MNREYFSAISTVAKGMFQRIRTIFARKGSRSRLHGFSLIEMLVVIAIVGIIAGLATVSFAGLARKYRIDNQVRRMHGDFSNIKVMAMTKGRTHFVTLNENSYTGYEDSHPAPDGDGILAVGSDRIVLTSNQSLNLSTVTNQQSQPIAWSAGGSSYTMAFNSRGLCTTTNNTICIFSSVNTRYDCINVSQTRITLGKLAVQGVCSAANCQAQ